MAVHRRRDDSRELRGDPQGSGERATLDGGPLCQDE